MLHSNSLSQPEAQAFDLRIKEIRRIQSEWVAEQERVLSLMEELRVMLDTELGILRSVSDETEGSIETESGNAETRIEKGDVSAHD